MASEESESKLIRNLRKEIIKLKRENAQLKKRNSRIENDWVEYLATKDEEVETAEEPKKKKRQTCGKCGSYSIETFSVGDKEFYRCSCGSKGRIL